MAKERPIRDLLDELGLDLLKRKGVLNDGRYKNLLNGKSVPNLLEYMNEEGIDTVYYQESGTSSNLLHEHRYWYLKHDGRFKNPNSLLDTEGNIRELTCDHERPRRWGIVFDRMNWRLNPYFNNENIAPSDVLSDAQEVMDIPHYLELVLKAINGDDSQLLWFRGQNDFNYGLIPSLYASQLQDEFGFAEEMTFLDTFISNVNPH